MPPPAEMPAAAEPEMPAAAEVPAAAAGSTTEPTAELMVEPAAGPGATEVATEQRSVTGQGPTQITDQAG